MRKITIFVFFILAVISIGWGISSRGVVTDITNFNNNLSSADVNVQAALDTLDNLTVGDTTSVGDCASGACFDGTSDGGTYLDFYDAQGRTRLIGGNTAAEVNITLPNTTGTLIHTETDPNALLTAGTDNVKDTHIDWGTGAGQVNPADFANQDIGDITITTGDWAVENDSHTHGSSTLAGIDISADTNLTAGDFITLTDDDLDVDTAAVSNGDTTHLSSADAIYDFCETTQGYYNATSDLDADLQDLADGSLTASKVAGVADADYGDVTVAVGAWGVEDNSHAHDTTTISGIDIGDDTNLAAGRSLALSGDSVEADAELYTDSKTIYFEDPIAADDFQSIWYTRQAATITYIYAESDQTVTLNLQRDDGTPADIATADLVPAIGSQTACASGCDTTLVDAQDNFSVGDRMDLKITSVANTPTWVSITFTFTYDD